MPLPRFAVVLLTGALMLKPIAATAQAIVQTPVPIATGWQMQDAAKVTAAAELLSTAKFKPESDAWYSATVPGTVLTTLVNNKVYPEPLYGENMRLIPESLNKTSYWYRTTFAVPAAYKGRRTWLHFGGINYSSEIWVNGQRAGTTRGAFIRTDLDISAFVRPGTTATLAVLVAPQPHPARPSSTPSPTESARTAATPPSTARRSSPPSVGTGSPPSETVTLASTSRSRSTPPDRLC